MTFSAEQDTVATATASDSNISTFCFLYNQVSCTGLTGLLLLNK